MSGNENIIRLPATRAVDDEAAAWFAAVDARALSPDEVRAFEAWKRQSARHREAYERAASVWGGYGALIADLPPGKPERLRFTLADRVRGYVPDAQAWTAAAALLLMIGAGLALWLRVSTAPDGTVVAARASAPTAASYATAVGGQRTVALADGSTVLLNTDSRVEVTFSTIERSVRLLRGEAFFTVATDTRRPFLVRTFKGDLRAVGTAFAVRLKPGWVQLTVAEGKVAVVEPARPATAKPVVLVSAGERAIVDEAEAAVSPIAPAALAAELAWREGYSVFSGETLPQAIAELGRYSVVEVEIADPSLNALRIRGRFRSGNIESMLGALEAGFGVRVERLDATHVRLSAA